MQQQRFGLRPLPRALLTLVAACGLTLPASATERAATVTAVVGDARSGSEGLGQQGAVADGEDVRTGDGGNCALLLEDDALVELCGNSSIALARRDTGERVVRVDAGEARIVVEPRGPDERIEIHTPAAVATILGTIVYVSVDPATGETTITSADHEILVRSSDDAVAGSRRIQGGEQVTIRRGEAPTLPRRLGRSTLQNLGGCLVDLHRASVETASAAAQQKAADRVAGVDMAAVDATPPVAAAPVAQLQIGIPGEAPENQRNVLQDIGGIQEAIALGEPTPPVGPIVPCDGVPGEHCGF